MAIPVYGAGTNADYNGQSSGTLSSPSVSGSNTIGIVMLFGQTSVTGYAATWNGSACTSLGGTTSGGERVEAFYIINPTAGVTNVVGSRTGSTNDFRVFAAYYTGAKQSGQPDVQTTVGPTASGTATGTATIVTQDSILMMWIRGDAGLTYTAGANTTLRDFASSIQHADSGSTSLAPGSRSISMTSGSQTWHGPVWAIAPAPAVGPANVKTINGLALGSVKTVNGLAIASVKTVNGLT